MGFPGELFKVRKNMLPVTYGPAGSCSEKLLAGPVASVPMGCDGMAAPLFIERAIEKSDIFISVHYKIGGEHTEKSL